MLEPNRPNLSSRPRPPFVHAAKWPPDDDGPAGGGGMPAGGGYGGGGYGGGDGNFKKGAIKPIAVRMVYDAAHAIEIVGNPTDPAFREGYSQFRELLEGTGQEKVRGRNRRQLRCHDHDVIES